MALPAQLLSLPLVGPMLRRLACRRERLSAERRELRRTRLRLARMRRDADAAQHMHDAVTGELSLIVRIAQRQIRNGSADGDLWRTVEESARHALDNTHRVIDRLDSRGRARAARDRRTRDAERRLRETLAAYDRRLSRLGFHGHATLHVTDDRARPSVERLELCLSLIGETYANVIRHARPESAYEMSVLWSANGFEITEANDVGGDGTLAFGRGLPRYRRLLERADGRLVTGVRHGLWSLFAFIPLH